MSTETGHRTNTQNDPYRSQLDRMEEKLNQLHEVVFTMLKGMEDARNAPGMMGMFARNTLPEIPDMSQFTSNGIQGD